VKCRVKRHVSRYKCKNTKGYSNGILNNLQINSLIVLSELSCLMGCGE